MKRLFGAIVLVAVAITFSAQAAAKSVVVVVAKSKAVEDEDELADKVRDELDERGFDIVSNEDLDDALSDELRDRLEEGDCTSLDCLVAIGGAAGADLAVALNLKQRGSKLYVGVAVIDTIDEEVKYTAYKKFKASRLKRIASFVADVVEGEEDVGSWEPEEDDVFAGASPFEEEEDLVESEEESEEEEEEPEERHKPARHEAEEEEEPEEEPDSFVEAEPEREPTVFTYAKWTGVGLTALSAGMIVFTGLMAKHYEDEYNSTFKKYRYFDFDAKADAKNYALATNVMIGVGATLAAATAVCFVLDLPSVYDSLFGESNKEVYLMPTATGFSVMTRF